eukprot:gnl/Chilomastix_cuspidata/3609.p1 GENE.gnl/Chilomastix_cuspidata/3609~~gnl/Chilomastix_cuspidata/3609.p1  ORF type:complete len:753 (+),score=206.51 gnl/Chilomastix_cuspidata/3609:55-2313(+)
MHSETYPTKVYPIKRTLTDPSCRAECVPRILQDRNSAAVSYMQKLCYQLRDFRLGYNSPRTGEKPMVNIAVGAKGSGKTSFSRVFYQPFIRQNLKGGLSPRMDLIKLVKNDPNRLGAGRRAFPDYDVEFRVIMYMVLSGRMLWTVVTGGNLLYDLKNLVTQAARMSHAPIDVEGTEEPRALVSKIADAFCVPPGVDICEQMRKFSQFQDLDAAALQSLSYALVGDCRSDAQALALLNEPVVHDEPPSLFHRVPLLVFLDELGKAPDAYALMASSLNDHAAKAALFTGAGVFEEYVAQEMETTRLFYVPYRLNAILQLHDLRRLLATAPEMEDKAYAEPEALLELLMSGGNPRLMIWAITEFSDTGVWPGYVRVPPALWKPIHDANLRMASIAGLPMRLKDSLVLRREGSVPLYLLEAEHNYTLAPSFVHPLDYSEPPQALTDYHQIVAPINPTSHGILFERFRELVRVCSQEGVKRRDYGEQLEKICVHVWQWRAALYHRLLPERPQALPGCTVQGAACAQARPGGREEPSPLSVSIPPIHVFGPFPFPSLVAGAVGHDNAWDVFFGDVDLTINPRLKPDVLSSAWAGAAFLETSHVDVPCARPTPLPEGRFFLNVDSAPGPDVGLLCRGTEGEDVCIAIDIKFSAKSGGFAPDVFALQAVMALSCDPPPTHIISVRGQVSGNSLRDGFKAYNDNREEHIRRACNEQNRQLPEALRLEPADSWWSIPHVAVGHECLGGMFSALLEEFRGHAS